MKRKRSKTGYNKLLASDATLLSRDPLQGLLELDTDSGPIELAMNRIVAERLMCPRLWNSFRLAKETTRRHLLSSDRSRRRTAAACRSAPCVFTIKRSTMGGLGMVKVAAICPICKTRAKQTKATTGDYVDINCTDCGDFQISRTFQQVVSNHPKTVRRRSLERARMRARYGSLPLVTTYDLP